MTYNDIDTIINQDPSKVFFTSDTHFGHANIIRFCSRPFNDVAEMNEALITNWNNVVPEDGIVFHLGDFALGSDPVWNDALNRLNGNIILIKGNHDSKHLLQFHGNKFAAIEPQMKISIHGQPIVLNHYPFLCYGGSNRGVWQLFGHVHSGPNNTGFDKPRLEFLLPTQYDVGVDNNNYTPINFEQVVQIINKQINENVSTR